MKSLLLDGARRVESVVLEAGQVEAVLSTDATRPDVTTLAIPQGAVVCPGAINAHTHLYSGLVPFDMPPPSPPPDNFVQILERVWWRLDRALDEQSLRAAARHYIAEALLAGTTTLIDHHESPELIEGSLDILADAAEELGIRLVTCYGATERNGGAGEAKRGLEECRRFIESNRRASIKGTVGLHASFTVSDDTLRAAGALANELSAPMHVHVAEDLADVADAKERGYAGPVERLLELGALPPGSIVAHGVHLDASQVRRVDEAGCYLVQNPRSNEGNKVGYPAALSSSKRVALGTDGYAANMADEWQALERLAAENGETAPLQPRRLGGYQLCSDLFETRFGETVEAGLVADLVVGEPGAPPQHVLVRGRIVVRNGALEDAAIDEIRAEAAEQATELWRRMAQF